MTTRSDALHDALERLGRYGYLDAPGFACHGPMGAETISALGYNELVASWVEAYTSRHQPLDVPPLVEVLDPADEASWRPALGEFIRASDWAELFRRQLREQPWPVVLRRWAPVLLAGSAGALTHGLIRVAHGVRALPTEGPPSELLLNELATGLAFWAATYTTLPGTPELRGRLTLPAAIAGLPRPHPPWSMIEAGTFARIDELDGFPAAVEALGPPETHGGALSELTAAFCRVMLAHSEVPAVPLVHAVTPVGAARTLLPYLPEDSIDAVYAQLWQISAAIVSGVTPAAEQPTRRTDAAASSPAEIVAHAVEHRDTHALKFAAACVQEHAIHPEPVYLLAARHVLDQLPAW